MLLFTELAGYDVLSRGSQHTDGGIHAAKGLLCVAHEEVLQDVSGSKQKGSQISAGEDLPRMVAIPNSAASLWKE